MATSDVDIANLALMPLGGDVITSFDDGSTNANRLKLVYGPTRDAVIRAYPWNCCMARASLSALSDAPAFGFANQFSLPEGPGAPPRCLRVYQIDGELDFQLKYKIEGRRILTDEAAPLDMLYIAQLTDPALYDALLVEAIAARIRSQIAFAVTGSTAASIDARQAYRDILAEARTVDAQEGSPDDFSAADWLESRF